MLAALDQLILFATWDGDDDAQMLAVNRASNLKELIALAIVDPYPYPTPYWDTATDSDDEYPPGALTPWYGVATVTYHSPPDVTFVETLATWVIAGFIAYAGQPGAAIAFLTIAPKFVLAFKTGDIGAIVDIIVDGAHIASVDTFSVVDGIKRLPVFADPDNDTHQIYIVKDDNPDTTVQVVREELAPDEFAPSTVRVSGGNVQTTPDGGTTWVDNPEADPRTNTAAALPANPTDNPQCDAAARMTALVEDTLNKLYLADTAISAINGIFILLVGLIPGIGVIIDLVVAMVEALLLLGVAELETAFTTTTFDDLKCLFNAHIGSNGLMTETEFASLQTDVAAHFGAGTVNTAMSTFWTTFGLNSFNNASVARTETGDCSDCTPAVTLTLCGSYGTSLTDLGSGTWEVTSASVVPGYNQIFLQGNVLFHMNSLDLHFNGINYSDYTTLTVDPCGFSGGASRNPNGQDMTAFYMELTSPGYITINVSPV